MGLVTNPRQLWLTSFPKVTTYLKHYHLLRSCTAWDVTLEGVLLSKHIHNLLRFNWILFAGSKGTLQLFGRCATFSFWQNHILSIYAIKLEHIVRFNWTVPAMWDVCMYLSCTCPPVFPMSICYTLKLIYTNILQQNSSFMGVGFHV